jgi:hypothetical protein
MNKEARYSTTPAAHSPEKSIALIVLGMHRSGTSALAGVLSLLGVDLGPTLEPPAADNQRGYFENMQAVSVNERLLGILGSGWSDVKPLPDRWWESEPARRFTDEIRAIAIRNFGGSSLWAVKDPRMCRLAPIWLPVLKDMNCEPRFIIMNRHPLEVAGSLGGRDGFAEGKSLLLWLSHTMQSAKWSEGYRRVFVTYDQLLADWKGVAGRIAVALEVNWPRGLDESAGEIEAFLSPQLRRHRLLAGSDETLPMIVLKTHKVIEKAAKDGESEDTSREMGSLYEELTEGFKTYGSLASVEEDLRAEIARKGMELAALHEELSRFRDETPKLRDGLAFAEQLAFERQDQIAQLARRINELRKKEA